MASVSTAFLAGNSTIQIKLLDTKFALDNGADEIDMVIGRGEFLKVTTILYLTKSLLLKIYVKI